ncbi:N(6)-adenine-specific methyltransferase METTL4 isoform X2 [Phycodurus eques]|uniref:N(6)-adenine-specific methyltransferase METTL4 isoform X2 n=1 Tax=Phycodurus eques TaxID=693459 RepID=UPI002ACE1FA8|nr:N(6)-adenine-specific methyltransferase METTL4 isoform X2 [Phycodurus eques]
MQPHVCWLLNFTSWTMSVLVEGTHGWHLDACSFIDQAYVRCFRRQGELKSEMEGRFNSKYFQILKSHGTGINNNDNNGHSDKRDASQTLERPPKKRKRKKHSELNQGEIESKAFHEKVRRVILEGTESLVESAKLLGYLHGGRDAVKDPLPCQECNLASLCDMAKELPLVDDGEQENCVQLLDCDGSGGKSHLDLFARVTENPADEAAVTMLMGEEYVIPPRAAFLLSDFSRMQPLLRYGHEFDVIVMDPPWENKSVKRSHRYTSLPSSQLKRLPISHLASAGSLVVTWVTNRPSHLRFVRDELYPHWGVEAVAQWFWVKVTTDGQFVFPLDSPHKKPYEVLVLGRYRTDSQASPSERCGGVPPVPDQRLIVSVPSALHSHKPSLAEVLKPYIKADGKCLELFARSLQPGWTSWGNEVLRFQHGSYFALTPSGRHARPPSSSQMMSPWSTSRRQRKMKHHCPPPTGLHPLPCSSPFSMRRGLPTSRFGGAGVDTRLFDVRDIDGGDTAPRCSDLAPSGRLPPANSQRSARLCLLGIIQQTWPSDGCFGLTLTDWCF